MEIEPRISHGRIRFARACAAVVFALSCCAILGWIVDVSFLRAPIPGGAPLRPVTSVLLAIAAAALLWTSFEFDNARSRSALKIAGFTIGAIATYVLVTNFFGLSNVTDNFLVPESMRAASTKGFRMPPQSSASLLLVGVWLGMLGCGGRLRRVGAHLASVALFVTFGISLSVIYHSATLAGYADNNNLAVTWMIAFYSLNLAGVVLNDENRLLEIFISDSLGGNAARRLLPAVVLVPTLTGWVRIVAQEYGYIGMTIGVTGSVLIMVGFMFAIVAFYSKKAHDRDGEQKAMQAWVEANESRYRDLFEYSQSILSTHGLDGKITSVNTAFIEATGYADGEIIGKMYKDFTPKEFWGESDAYLRTIGNEGEARGLATIITKSGKRLVWEYRNILIDDPVEGPYVMGSALDVTHHLRLQNQLEKMSLTDELTGLLNRRGFLTLAEQQLRLEAHQNTARGLMLMFADMDGLKRINDTLGHEAGSEALQILARVLKSVVRGADLVARWGGDEFVILTAGADETGTAQMSMRIEESLRAFNATNVKPFTVACSIGTVPVDMVSGMSFDEVIARADEAMYEVKKKRKAGREQNAAAMFAPVSGASVMM